MKQESRDDMQDVFEITAKGLIEDNEKLARNALTAFDALTNQNTKYAVQTYHLYLLRKEIVETCKNSLRKHQTGSEQHPTGAGSQ